MKRNLLTLKKKGSCVKKGLKNLEIGNQEPQKLNHKIESQSRKNLQTQVARIKQTIEKAVDKATLLAERICTFNHDQGSTMISVLTSLV